MQKLSERAASFGTKFLADPIRDKQGRAQRVLVGPYTDAVGELLDALGIPKICLKEDDVPETVKERTKPTVFAVKKDFETCSTEAAHFTALRLGFLGTRKMVAVELVPFFEFCNRKVAVSELKPKQLYHTFKTSDAAGLKAYVEADPEKHRVFFGTLGPGDLFILPGGWIFVEKIGSQDYVGFRKIIFPNTSEAITTRTNRYQLQVGVPHEDLQAIVDAFALRE